MTKLPAIDFAAAWEGLPAKIRARIGALAIERALFYFAGDAYHGDEPGTGIAYLDARGRDEAMSVGDVAGARLSELIGDVLPDLFGCNPSPEHPNGTDPAWATPIVFRVTGGRS